jgi:3-deoxy-D-manno-octulosonic acid (KDO) 8-phosphate synthase
MNKSVKLKNQFIKNDTDKLTLISGPCLLESEKLVRLVAKLMLYSLQKVFTMIQLQFLKRQ